MVVVPASARTLSEENRKCVSASEFLVVPVPLTYNVPVNTTIVTAMLLAKRVYSYSSSHSTLSALEMQLSIASA